jgi:hypothetical protein
MLRDAYCDVLHLLAAVRQQIGPCRASLNNFQNIRLVAHLFLARCARALHLSFHLHTLRQSEVVTSRFRNRRLIRYKTTCSLAFLNKQVSIDCI